MSMKELNSGELAPSIAYVYSANSSAAHLTFLPLLLDRLGKPKDGMRHRLILSRPLWVGEREAERNVRAAWKGCDDAASR